jgi:hypothetical protein
MRRWLTILLLVVLPLQFSWAAAASYCQHDEDASTQHVGHHDHQHQAADSSAAGDATKSDTTDAKSKSTGLDGDCAYCQMSIAKSLSIPTVALLSPTVAYDLTAVPGLVGSPLRDRIERPKWHRA